MKARKFWTATAAVGASLSWLALVLVLSKAPEDGFQTLREMGGVETTYREGEVTWHEFQFAEPCRLIRPELDALQRDWLNNHSEALLTDIEDRETGPDAWTPMHALTLRSPLKLTPGQNCGFEVATKTDTHGFQALIKRVRSLFG